jgi:hypothetical protein
MKKYVMNEKERVFVLGKIDWEGGYEYFITGSEFKDIKDERFHELRKKLVNAWVNLEDYLGELDYE